MNFQKNKFKKENKKEECKHCGYPHNSYNLVKINDIKVPMEIN